MGHGGGRLVALDTFDMLEAIVAFQELRRVRAYLIAKTEKVLPTPIYTVPPTTAEVNHRMEAPQ